MCKNNEEELGRLFTWKTEKSPGQELMPREEPAIRGQLDFILHVYFRGVSDSVSSLMSDVTGPESWISLWVLMERGDSELKTQGQPH